MPSFINSRGHRCLVGDVFNVKHQYWVSSSINPKGREIIQEKQLEILSTGELTFWPTDINKNLDLLDFFIFKGLSHNSADICKTQSRDSIGSNINNRHHQYTYYNSPKPIKTAQQPNKLRSIQNSNRRKFTTQYPAQNTKDIEEAIAEFTNVIQKAAWGAIPDDKPQTKYSEYAWEVEDQIREK
jgi:hypothetical protein